MFSKALGPLLCSILLARGVTSAVIPRAKENLGDGLKQVDHDKVRAIPQNGSPGVDNDLELRFNPLIYNAGGCDPYPAVDAEGNLGKGLKPTGGGADGCDKGGDGQIYVRMGESHGREAILYSVYVPKVRWAEGDENGHRHYWASAVVWIDSLTCDRKDARGVSPVGISLTKYDQTWNVPKASDISWVSSSAGVSMPKLQLHDREMSPFVGADGPKLYQRTLVSWDGLTNEAREALNAAKYEKTQVPFNNANFQGTLDAAYSPDLFGGLPKDKCSPDSKDGGFIPGDDEPLPGGDEPLPGDDEPLPGDDEPLPGDDEPLPGGDEPLPDLPEEGDFTPDDNESLPDGPSDEDFFPEDNEPLPDGPEDEDFTPDDNESLPDLPEEGDFTPDDNESLPDGPSDEDFFPEDNEPLPDGPEDEDFTPDDNESLPDGPEDEDFTPDDNESLPDGPEEGDFTPDDNESLRDDPSDEDFFPEDPTQRKDRSSKL